MCGATRIFPPWTHPRKSSSLSLPLRKFLHTPQELVEVRAAIMPEEAEAGGELEDVVEADAGARRGDSLRVVELLLCAPSSSRIAAPAATRADFATSCRQEERLLLLHSHQTSISRR